MGVMESQHYLKLSTKQLPTEIEVVTESLKLAIFFLEFLVVDYSYLLSLGNVMSRTRVL